MADNKQLVKQNIDLAIDPALGIGGILAANHNDVLTQTLNTAGKQIGIYHTASGDLSGNAPTGTFLWNGNDPTQITPFTVRFSKLSSDLDDTGDVLALMAVGGVIRIKDEAGRSFVLFFQSYVAGTDGNLDPIYDVSVIGKADNPNYIYAPTETQVAGFDMYSAGGAAGGAVNAVVAGQGIDVDNTSPTNPIVNLGGTIDAFVGINIDGSTSGFASLDFSLLDFSGNSGLWQLNGLQYNMYLEDSLGTSRVDVQNQATVGHKVTVLDFNGGDDKSYTFDIGDLTTGFTLLTVDASSNDQAEVLIQDDLFSVAMTQPSGQENVMELSAEQWGFEVADPSGNRQSGISAEASASSSSLQLNLLTDQNGDDLTHQLDMSGVDGRMKLFVQENAGGFPETAIEFRKDELRIITPNVHGGTATVGQLLQLQNINGEVEFVNAGAALNTIYSADDSLAGARAVDLNGNQLTWTEGANIIYFNNGRIGVQEQVFGGSRLGDSVLQATNIDLTALNFKDTGQATALSMFFTKVAGVGVDGYVTTMKNFVDDVNVISVAGLGAETFGGASRQVEATLGLRNDFTGGEFRVWDTFNNDYDAGTPVAEAQGWVAIHGGGATPKDIGLWRYDGVTYTPIFEVSPTNAFTFDANVSTDGFLTVRNSLTISGGATQNLIQMQVTGNTTPYAGLAFPSMFWQNIGGDDIFFIARSGTPDASDDFGIDLVNLTDRRIGTVPDKDFTFGSDDDAIHDNVAAEINALPLKATPVAGDQIIIEDSAAGFVKKRANFPTAAAGVTQTEGTWTPTLVDQGGGATYTGLFIGAYVRTGKLVSYMMTFGGIGTSGVPSGSLVIQNFPFSANGSGRLWPAVIGSWRGGSANWNSLTCRLGSATPAANVTLAFFDQTALNTQYELLPFGPITFTSGQIYISGFYFTDDP